MAITIATAVRNAACNAAVDLIDAGSGTATGILKIGTAAMGTLLASHVMTNPAFGNAAAGVATAAAITDDSDVDATGTAAAFVIVDRDDATLISGSVGTSGEDINFDSVAFVAGGTSSITALTYTVPASA